MLSDNGNSIFELATQFVNHTARSVFLTGKAGTGKTTFLRYIRENSFKKMAVVAPTGVAAINAGGTTMHSFFQLPFGPYIPATRYGWNTDRNASSDPDSLLSGIRFNANKRELLQELELLIIDEVSMVRADMLDAVDTILRHFRNQPLAPFGGVQMLYIGDLFQLPPVISKEEWELLQAYYKSPFFFDALALQQSPPVYLELNKIYRQQDTAFINILNNIRNNCVTGYDLEHLHEYYQPDFMAPRGENYITLTSHNARAEQINQAALNDLRGSIQSYEASVTGEFSEKAYPAEKTLQLKEGAQIMLIKNDKGETRRYFNGKIGTIKKLDTSKITIEFPDEPEELTLEKETWKNIRYNYDKEKDKIEEEELGTFSQFPIRLAWAITIHKSQGLTFDKAVIDAGQSFAPGQVYVALSRLRSIQGMVLRSRITPQAISTDRRVTEFTEIWQSEADLEDHLRQDQLTYIRYCLLRSFDWSRLTDTFRANMEELPHRQLPDKIKAMELAHGWLEKVILQQETATKFTRQLDLLLPHAEKDGYRQLNERVQAAVAYFIRALDDDQLISLGSHIDEIRVRQKIKKYLQGLRELKAVLTRKRQQLEEARQMVEGLEKGVDTTRLLTGLQDSRKSRETETIPEEGEKGGVTGKPGKSQKGDTHRISLGLFREGIPISEIATRRGMVPTTVESHLASFILTGEVEVKELVPEHKIEPIIVALKETGSQTLGPVKNKLGDGYSFGEIRAVINHLKKNQPRE